MALYADACDSPPEIFLQSFRSVIFFYCSHFLLKTIISFALSPCPVQVFVRFFNHEQLRPPRQLHMVDAAPGPKAGRYSGNLPHNRFQTKPFQPQTCHYEKEVIMSIIICMK